MRSQKADPFNYAADYRIAPYVGVALICGWVAHLLFMLLSSLSPSSAIFHVLLQTFLSTGLFITAHDSMHGIASPFKRRLNRWIGAVAIFLYGGFSYEKLLSAHLAHHANPATERDPDFTSAQNEELHKWLFQFGRRYYGWTEFLKMHLHVAFVWLVGGALWKVFAYFAIPAWLSAFQLFYFGTYLPHRTEATSPHTNSHRARSNSLPTLLSLLTCYHFGYHLEHHENPRSPWWTLPRIKHRSNTN